MTAFTTTSSVQTQGKQAIVIGASMGGLLAARALADHYDHVTIVERDTFPTHGENRKGVPQGRHAHALLPSGRAVLEALFPNISQELVSQGALLADAGTKSVRCINGNYHGRFPSGVQALFASRPRLEAQVRARLLALPNVSVIENGNVLGLSASADRSRITGVSLVRRSESDQAELLTADLVVDAAGRGSRSPAWLEALGYDRPAEEQVQVDVSYASRVYRRKPGQAQDAYIINITPAPPNRRSGVMIAMEDDRWLVTLVGYLGDEPPTDPDGFLAFAKTLPAPDIYETIRHAEPVGEVIPAKYPASMRRHYEKLTRFPQGYLVFGDAISSFNPTYGQGMSVAALEAQILQQCVENDVENLAQRFFVQVSQLVDIPWSIAVGGDLRFPEVIGKRSPIQPLINWYIGKLHCAARVDPQVVRAFGLVTNLRAAPSSLLHPRVAWRVLLGNLRTQPKPMIRQLWEAHSS